MQATAAIRSAPVLRPVAPSDAPAMERFVAGLGAASRRWRFHGAVNGCTPALLRQLTVADGVRHVAFVTLIGADDGETIVGEARYVVDDDGAGAEFAIAVADSVRGCGVADRLLRALLDAARRAGLHHLQGDVLEGNERMAGFMRRHGFEAEIDVWAAQPGSVRWQRRLAPRRMAVAGALLASLLAPLRVAARSPVPARSAAL